MWFYYLMFSCNLIYSLLLVGAGIFVWKRSDVEIGKNWFKIGSVMLLITALIQVPFYGQSREILCWVTLIIAVVESTILMISICPTRCALRKTLMEGRLAKS